MSSYCQGCKGKLEELRGGCVACGGSAGNVKECRGGRKGVRLASRVRWRVTEEAGDRKTGRASLCGSRNCLLLELWQWCNKISSATFRLGKGRRKGGGGARGKEKDEKDDGEE